MRFGVIGDPDAPGASAAALAGAGCELVAGVDAVDAVVVTGPVDAELESAIARLAAAGTPVLGTGEGFAALCRAGVLDGSVEPAPAAGEVTCTVEGRPTPFTAAIPAGRQLRLRAACGLRYVHHDLDAVEAEARVVLRFAAATGDLDGAVAGVCSGDGNVVGLLPGCDPQLYRAAMAWQRGTPARVR